MYIHIHTHIPAYTYTWKGNNMYFNERELRKAMVNAEIDTWEELCKRTQIPRKSLYNIRVGESIPTLEQAYSIKRVLKLDNYRFFRVFPED
jgi:hypothetical protein